MQLKSYSINRWCELFGIQIIDDDGFKTLSLDTPVTLEIFLAGISVCTIDPIDGDKYRTLDWMMKNL